MGLKLNTALDDGSMVIMVSHKIDYANTSRGTTLLQTLTHIVARAGLKAGFKTLDIPDLLASLTSRISKAVVSHLDLMRTHSIRTGFSNMALDLGSSTAII